MKRESWDQYFLGISKLIGTRSTCIRRQIGAVLARGNQILSTGYNGSPKGHDHCFDIGCIRDELEIKSGTHHEICRAIHAEQNAIVQAAFHGVSIKGSTLYCDTFPCVICAKMLINAGISGVIYSNEYTDNSAQMLFDKSDIYTAQLLF